jgi:hypothetical protein
MDARARFADDALALAAITHGRPGGARLAARLDPGRRLLVVVLELLDLVLNLQLLSLYVVDHILVGHRPVDFFLQG